MRAAEWVEQQRVAKAEAVAAELARRQAVRVELAHRAVGCALLAVVGMVVAGCGLIAIAVAITAK